MFSARAFCTASLSRKLDSGSPPPSLAATVISRVILVNIWPRLASVAPFFLLIVAHLLCPDILAPRVSCSNVKGENYPALYQRARRFDNAHVQEAQPILFM